MENKFLHEYLADPENPITNYNLAVRYYKIDQTAAAVTYFLRCADRTSDLDLAYECLIHMGDCFAAQGERETHTKFMYELALSTKSDRPEAYQRICDMDVTAKNFSSAHNYCKFALKICNFNSPNFKFYKTPFRNLKTYFEIEEAHSAWWTGKHQKAAKLFNTLNQKDYLTEEEKMLVETNIKEIQKTTAWHDPLPYTKDQWEKIRYKFAGSHLLEKNYAQVYQDLFVLCMLDGKRNGCFLEVGGARPFFGNNTALLELEYDWTGVSLELESNFAEEYRAQRHNTTMFCVDATQTDYSHLLGTMFADKTIDYLQLDIDPPDATYNVLMRIPFDEYKFRVITYEHDYYADPTKSYRDKSRDYLRSKGYVLVADNISPDENCPFEDWWVHPDLVDKNILASMTLVDGETKYAEDYMFPGDPLFSQLVNMQQASNGKETFAEIIDVTPTKTEFGFNESQQSKTMWIIDNFYDDPDSVRNFALKQKYFEGGWGRGFIGRRSAEQFLFPGLKEKFEQIMGEEITAWEEHDMNGRFQNAVSGEPLAYHCDSQKWGGMLYLTPDAPYQCGTTLYAHKKTRARNFFQQGWGDAWSPDPDEIYSGGVHCDGTHFEKVDVCGNVYNRLFIFDASNIHSASEYFGSNMNNGRLWQMFFFDTK